MKKRSFEKWLHERVSESVWAVTKIGGQEDYVNLTVFRCVENIISQENELSDVIAWVKANMEELADKISQPKSLKIYEYQQSALERVYIELCKII